MNDIRREFLPQDADLVLCLAGDRIMLWRGGGKQKFAVQTPCCAECPYRDDSLAVGNMRKRAATASFKIIF